MPILKREPDRFPDDLLETNGAKRDGLWWAMYTLPRREKQLMRKLLALQVPYYCPIIAQRHRSPNGRLRVSYEPLFKSYVFVHTNEHQRVLALQTNCISRSIPVPEKIELSRDLRQIQRLIDTGAPLAPESRLIAGEPVRVKTGAFAGFEGVIIRREHESRLLVAVNFMEQGASVLLDDCQFESLR